MHIAITGANGFVGRRLGQTLRAGDWGTREIVRSNPTEGQVACGSLDEAIDWRPLLEGCDIVVHAAARVHQMQDDPTTAAAKFDRVNHLATLELARQAATAGVRRLVFLSSIKVNGESTSGRGPFRADDVPAPEDAYGRSKWAAEQGLWAVATSTGLEVVVIRPPLVYGPGVKANFAKLIQWVQRGVPLPLGRVNNLRSLVAVDNLCHLVHVACQHPAAAGGTFLVSDDHDLSTPELIRTIAKAVGRSPRLLPVPLMLLKVLGQVTGKSAEVDRLLGSCQVDVGATKERLGWKPVVGVEDGVRAAVGGVGRRA